MPDHTEAKGDFSLYYHLFDGKTGTFRCIMKLRPIRPDLCVSEAVK